MRSIERTLLLWILGALALGTLLVALVTYFVTLEEMNEVFDADLQNVAKAVATYHRAAYRVDQADDVASPKRTDPSGEYEIVTLTWTLQGRQIFSSDPRVALPFSNTEGLSQPVIGGEQWTVYSNVSEAGIAQAAQRVAARQQMAGESAGKVFAPLTALAFVIGALLVFGLRRGLRPLGSAAQDIAQRSAGSLQPIALAKVPTEIMPLVSAINDLMSRLALAFATQRRFLADAAHELRTPVTALRLQVQLLNQSNDEAGRVRALAELDAGVARTQRLVEQLLHVARTEPEGEVSRREPVDLAETVRHVVSALSLKAEHWNIDLGVTTAKGAEAVIIEGDAEQITVLLNNLVENALRYTPPDGVVDVEASVVEGAPQLRVADTGPGIAEAERASVFDRFYRGVDASALARDGSGSGLGLAIVRAIADRHGAHVGLHTAASGKGLEVRVRFPAAARQSRSRTDVAPGSTSIVAT